MATGDDPPGARDRWRQVVQRRHDPAREFDLAATVAFAVAEAEGVDPTALDGPPLYESVDVAALEAALFGGDHVAGSVTFRYAGYRVEVGSDGWVRVAVRA
jgi:hypothetical protein